MKSLLSKIIVLSILFSTISCAVKDNTIFTGRVVEIQQGKDGYTAKIEDQNGKVYYGLVSISNLGGPEFFQKAELGDEISVKGTLWKMEEEDHIKVEKIISLKHSK